ncbi:MAG: glycosyltransferase family 4 protein [Nitrospirae bacterium]|nr:glycosyltransferase family 4 protein [Nitrospirota bacterium]
MNLILFFTYGVSLRTWDEKGLLDREVLLYQKIAKDGVRVTFVTYGDEGDYAYKDRLPDIEILPFYAFTRRPSFRILTFLHSLLLPFIIRNKVKNADILKTNQLSGSWAAVIGKLLYRKKLIVRCGYEWYKFVTKEAVSLPRKLAVFFAEWLAYRTADRIILSSHGDREFVLSKFRIKNSKITVNYNFIDTGLFKPITSDIKKDHLLYIGRLSRQKNLFSLFDAIKGSAWTLDIIGDGELEAELTGYARANNIRVNFLGRVANNKLPEIINQYPLVILPSCYEGNPKVLLEAMSCGCAVIGADVDGIREIIKNNVNGVLCGTNAESIKGAIEGIINDKELQERLGRGARLFVEENCSIEAAVKRELSVYKGLT